jgi:hypothetical protein
MVAASDNFAGDIAAGGVKLLTINDATAAALAACQTLKTEIETIGLTTAD